MFSGLQASLLPGLGYIRQKENRETSVMVFFRVAVNSLSLHLSVSFEFFQYITVGKLDVFSKRNTKNVSSHFLHGTE